MGIFDATVHHETLFTSTSQSFFSRYDENGSTGTRCVGGLLFGEKIAEKSEVSKLAQLKSNGKRPDQNLLGMTYPL